MSFSCIYNFFSLSLSVTLVCALICSTQFPYQVDGVARALHDEMSVQKPAHTMSLSFSHFFSHSLAHIYTLAHSINEIKTYLLLFFSCHSSSYFCCFCLFVCLFIIIIKIIMTFFKFLFFIFTRILLFVERKLILNVYFWWLVIIKYMYIYVYIVKTGGWCRFCTCILLSFTNM